MPEKTIISAQLSEDILNLLQDRGWPVYEYYKPSSINRRLKTCIEIINKEPLDKYYSKLESDPNEVDKLANAILVGVTSFFRDSHVFQAVRRQIIIPLLKKQLEDKEEIRIWSAACSNRPGGLFPGDYIHGRGGSSEYETQYPLFCQRRFLGWN